MLFEAIQRGADHKVLDPSDVAKFRFTNIRPSPKALARAVSQCYALKVSHIHIPTSRTH